MQIETERLLLRPIEESDDRDIFRYSKQKQVGPNAGWKPHANIQETRAIMKQLFLGENNLFGIVYRQNGRLIGTIGLIRDAKRENSQVLMLGYAMSKPYWGQGLMTEAAQALIRFGFEQLELELISAYCYPHNDRSKSVLRKCGFAYEGTLRRCATLYDGQTLDEECYSLLKEDYQP